MSSGRRQAPFRTFPSAPAVGHGAAWLLLVMATAAMVPAWGDAAAAWSTGSAERVLLRREALARLDRGEGDAAAGLLDTLLLDDVQDRAGAYWAARAREAGGRRAEARCRYLRIEGLAPGTPEAVLSQARRMRLERGQADALADSFRSGAGGAIPGTILLLPPENIGSLSSRNESESEDHPQFALAWTFLLFDALRGSDLCPCPMPATLVLLDLFHNGHAVRASQEVSLHPVNTVEGLRARLRRLLAPDGTPYLESPVEGWSPDLSEALKRFQADHDLPATGEADLATEGRLDSVFRDWLLSELPPLDPRKIPEAARLLGASRVLRSTYRLEEGRATVQLTVLDPNGRAIGSDPINLTFPPEESASMAWRAADLLRASPPRPPRPPAKLPPGLLAAFASVRLLLDRGMPQLARVEAESIPSQDAVRAGLGRFLAACALSPGSERRMEEDLRSRWIGTPMLDPSGALDGLLLSLGAPAPVDAGDPSARLRSLRRDWLEPPPLEVLGGEGILRIHGEGW